MNELFAGVVGGVGLFIVGMWLITENLKALTTRRLRRNAGQSRVAPSFLESLIPHCPDAPLI